MEIKSIVFKLIFFFLIISLPCCLIFRERENFLDKWSAITGENVEAVRQYDDPTIAQKALKSDKFFTATAALQDRSQMGSAPRLFADHIFDAIGRHIQANLPTVREELDEFQNEFDERELNWIRFLSGETVQGFRYASGQVFRSDSDRNLESNHDYVQLVLPNWSKSHYSNQDLYIARNAEVWKNLFANCPHLKDNIRLNMQLNAIRMLHFWKFCFDFRETDVILVDNRKSPLHSNGDHNALRLTRFIGALGLFKCESILNVSKNLLETYFKAHTSYSYWSNAWEKAKPLY
ncbi:MAG: hypothetical protein LBI77_02655 [Puniceicoccales bacterium]|nr:hypothetical protein [Puniceicoccales bacterium]